MIKTVIIEDVFPPFGGKPRSSRREFACKTDQIKKLLPMHVRSIPWEAVDQLFKRDKCEWIDAHGNRHVLEMRELRMNNRDR